MRRVEWCGEVVCEWDDADGCVSLSCEHVDQPEESQEDPARPVTVLEMRRALSNMRGRLADKHNLTQFLLVLVILMMLSGC